MLKAVIFFIFLIGVGVLHAARPSDRNSKSLAQQEEEAKAVKKKEDKKEENSKKSKIDSGKRDLDSGMNIKDHKEVIVITERIGATTSKKILEMDSLL